MKYKFINQGNGAELSFCLEEDMLSNGFVKRQRRKSTFTIALNTSCGQNIIIDGKKCIFPSGSMLLLFDDQTFELRNAQQIIAWQYNNEFFNGLGIEGINHGMFSADLENHILTVDPPEVRKVCAITKMCTDEFSAGACPDREMLEILMRQLIVIVYRMARNQHLDGQGGVGERFELIKKFIIMVEKHYKDQHKVQFYAEKLNRSPKTLSNLFLLTKYRSPILIIHERIIREAKKLFYYTDMSAKEISYELGFQEQAHFSRFFKNYTEHSPSSYKKKYLHY